MESPQDFGQYVSLHFAKQDIVERAVSFNCLSLTVLRAALVRVATFLRDDAACRFTQLTDITAVHYPENAEEFVLVYHLAAPMPNRRIRLKVQTARDVGISRSTLYNELSRGTAEQTKAIRTNVYSKQI